MQRKSRKTAGSQTGQSLDDKSSAAGPEKFPVAPRETALAIQHPFLRLQTMKTSTSRLLISAVAAVTTAGFPLQLPAQQAAPAPRGLAAAASSPEWTTAQPETGAAPPSNRFSRGGGLAQTLPGNFQGGYISSYTRAETPPTPLVLRFGPTSEEKESQIEEDVKVMSVLLDESLDRAFENAPAANPAGAVPPGRGSNIRGIIVEGYGAIFRLNVNFPLVGASESPKHEEPKPKDSEWEATKRQLYSDPTLGPAGGGIGWRNSGAPVFSAENVATVENTLVHCLKNASHLRGLDANDSVVISVQGASQIASVLLASGYGGAGGGATFGRGAGYVTGPTTYLSIRAKKSDIDAFAAGTLNYEDFKSKVTVASYAASRGKLAAEGAMSDTSPVPNELAK